VDHGCCFGFYDNLGKWSSKSHLTPPRWRGNRSTPVSRHITTRLRKVLENVDPAKFRRLSSASPHLGFWVPCCWCELGGPPLRVRLLVFASNVLCKYKKHFHGKNVRVSRSSTMHASVLNGVWGLRPQKFCDFLHARTQHEK